jgi:hypothetical protein
VGSPQESMLVFWQTYDAKLLPCDLCGGWLGGRRSQCWWSGMPKMEFVTYGCVTSVEAGGEAVGVNVGGLEGLRCEKLLLVAV